VGADQGYFSLAINERKQRVYATENKKGPYSGLVKTIAGFPKASVIPLFQDGLKTVPEDVDFIAILGMGGLTISRILEGNLEALKRVKEVLIEPQSDFSSPIKTLLNNGFENDSGEYLKETRYYPLLHFKKTNIRKDYTSLELELGPYPLKQKDVLLKEFLLKEQTRYNNLNEEGKKNHQTEIKFYQDALCLFDLGCLDSIEEEIVHG
jgi:tRNA (adenine22-N1)-methyltransferase